MTHIYSIHKDYFYSNHPESYIFHFLQTGSHILKVVIHQVEQSEQDLTAHREQSEQHVSQLREQHRAELSCVRQASEQCVGELRERVRTGLRVLQPLTHQLQQDYARLKQDTHSLPSDLRSQAETTKTQVSTPKPCAVSTKLTLTETQSLPNVPDRRI